VKNIERELRALRYETLTDLKRSDNDRDSDVKLLKWTAPKDFILPSQWIEARYFKIGKSPRPKNDLEPRN